MIKSHPYLPNASLVLNDMLKEIGVEKIEELFSDVPFYEFTIDGIPKNPMDEQSVIRNIKSILSKNKVFFRSFMGGGPWFHYIPSPIKYLINRGEFLTSYTPYQPEISQGVLQSLFEFQSMVCELYKMEVANASLYDLPTAIGESALLASRVTGRRKFIIPASLPEDRKRVIRSYTEPMGIQLKEAPFSEDDGNPDLEFMKLAVDKETAGVYTETPNFFGVVDPDLKPLVELAHDAGALAIVGADPLSLGIFKPPGEYGADIAVGDGQPLGIPPGAGGNTLGLIACRDDSRIIRNMPGRIVGLTKTKDGQRTGFVLALTTREQHIRREKATSNICTNEALLAIAATIYLAIMGREGISTVAKKILNNTQYTIESLRRIGVSPLFKGTHFRDFAIKVGNLKKLNDALLQRGILGGRDLSEEFRMNNVGLFAVTELHTKEDLEEFIETVALESDQ
ncbi:MAG: aminomethyl-transferring glycine dehydrogenase subunit GcvPA [Candidatus Methanomethylicaceae archaeon]